MTGYAKPEPGRQDCLDHRRCIGRFAAEGARVFVADINGHGAAMVASSIGENAEMAAT